MKQNFGGLEKNNQLKLMIEVKDPRGKGHKCNVLTLKEPYEFD